jgi:hypothetical protein
MIASTIGVTHDTHKLPSHVSRVAAWDWHDGPTEGLLQFDGLGGTYHFQLLEERPGKNGDEDIRVFGLYPVPSDCFGRFVTAVSQYHQPRWPIWWPVWQFPSDETLRQMNDLVDAIKESAEPLLWIIATDCSFRLIRAFPIVDQSAVA